MSWIGRLLGRMDARSRNVQRNDGWGNVITGLGTKLDKRSGGFMSWFPMTDLEVREQWLGDDVTKRIIEILPREMMRPGYKIKVPDDQEAAEEICAQAEQLQLDVRFRQALEFKRAYGGGALFPVIDGAQGDLSEPLNPTAITKVLAFHVLEPRELYPVTWYTDLTNPKFGQPETYRFVPVLAGGQPSEQTMAIIHESRLVIFQGIKVSRLHQAGNRYGWGDNCITAIRDVIRDFGLTWGAAASLMQDFAQAVLKIDGLGNLIIQDQDRIARDRLAQIDLIRSFMKMVVIDAKDSFSREQTPMSGFPDILDRFKARLAFAADLPIALLFGESSSGLDSSSEGDREFMYDRVRGAEQEVTPLLEECYRFLILQIDGPFDGKEPEIWSAEWNPLWTPTEKEVAETRWLHAQSDGSYLDRQTLTNEEVRGRWAGDGYNNTITLDDDAWNAQQAELDATPDPAALAAMGYVPAAGGAPPAAATDDKAAQTAPPGTPADPGMRSSAPPTPKPPGPISGKTVPVIAHQRMIKPRGSSANGPSGG